MLNPFEDKTKREIMIEIGQDSGPEPGIYNYSKDIPFKINLTLKDKGHTVFFLSSIFDTLGIIGETKRAKYLSNLKTIAANLMTLHFNRVGEYVYYSRDNSFYKKIKRYSPHDITIRKIRKLIDLLINKKLLEARKGYHNKYLKEGGHRSRIKSTAKFLNILRSNFINRTYLYETETDCIILNRSKKGSKNHLKKGLKKTLKTLIDYKDNSFTKSIRADCRSYNQSLKKTKIVLKKCKAVNEYLYGHSVPYKKKEYHRVFNENFKRGGRFYGPWWLHHIPSELRQYILINGNKTVERDYSSLIIHQIYNELGLNYYEENTYSSDPYILKDVAPSERKLNKAIIQISLNCRNFDGLDGALIGEFRKGNLKGKKPKKKEIIRRLNIFREMNPKISRYVYSNCASRFQFQDSEIARSIINKCMYRLIPVLCVHDSFIGEYTHSNFIVDTMNSAIESAGFTSVPLIK
ncbi:hypothetical protein OAT26_01455 [Candidatus Pelagibacter sp.]|nr:hypothetical protein [Candidatus Pelagibacter sp.]